MSNTSYSISKELFWTKDARVGKITIMPEPTPLRVGKQNLKGRRQVIVVNDASTYLFHSINPHFTLGSGEYIFHSPGEVITYHLNPEEDLTIYAKTKEYPVRIRVFEVI
jgi:hypothetical protein